VAIGSLVVNRLLRGEISARYVPAAALALALAVIDLSFTARAAVPAPMLAGVAAFLRLPGSWHMAADLLVIAIAGGIFIVPLYALLQTLGEPAARSRDVAANNVVNAAAMVGVSVAVGALQAAGASIADVFLALGLIGVAVAFGAYRGVRPQRVP
jgi:acyl-[acyl-carrier-protein]-phospholipid O-acyltransferase/long-chain-fatty-acid--[acyl-carrier-protein] ligase